jgi:PIN domain nuclease of toxin-antitoxin system
MRYLIDTHIFIWYAKEPENLSRNVIAIIEDYENEIYVSSESLREFVLLWNSKPHIRRWWKSPIDMIRSIEEDCQFKILYLYQEHYEQYARLQINVEQEH